MTLLKSTLKSNLKMFLIFLAIMAFYLSMIMVMYDPQMINSMEALIELLPQQLIQALGFQLSIYTYTGFLASYFYGMLAIGFPTILTVVIGYRAIGKFVEQGSMAYLLSTPNNRTKIVLTQAVSMVVTLLLLFVSITLIGIVLSEIMFPSALEVGKFIMINIGAFLYFFAASSITFIFSCLFNEGKNSLQFGAGIPVAFLLIHMLGQMEGNLEFLKYLTMLTLFNANDIITDGYNPLPMFVLFIVGIIGYTLAIIIFRKRNLPI